jgi:hypothetical protein
MPTPNSFLQPGDQQPLIANSGQLMEQPGNQPLRLGAPTPNSKMVHSRAIGWVLEGPGSLVDRAATRLVIWGYT